MPTLGVSTSSRTKPLPLNQSHLMHPAPRLQHSPSLPNISFSLHPGQPPMSQNDKIPKNGPSAPPSPKIISTDTTSDKHKDKDTDTESRPRHVKYASVDPISRVSRHIPKAHARRRTERDQPHALLTPPLTPSASIRTTTSDSAATNAKGASEPEPNAMSAPEPEPTSTNDKNLIEAFAGLTVGAPGVQSNIRQRFNFPGTPSDPSIKAQEPFSQPSGNLVEGAQSPPCFYTTPFGNSSGHGGYQQLDHGYIVGKPMGPMDFSTPTAPHPMGFRYEQAIPTCYTPDGACSYCPSRSPVTNYAPPYSIPCPTPAPTYHPAPSLIQNVVNVAPFPSLPPFFQYEYMEPQAHPLPATPQWGFDPAIAAVGPGLPHHLFPLVPVNGPTPAPFFVREEATLPAHQIHAQYQQPPTFREQELGPGVSPQPFAHISTPTPDASPKTYPSHSLVKYEYDANGQTTERNQLSLARIKAGDDLRTTVMIKNIPNKMSDIDLTHYIHQVCPRRIDFLYLRMDFKNGCNVGYGFVNFITVQDLAHFVEERLGAKWNMFSSEKILQMSYANFQGKEALIEKFKNSAIMDEREAWRPRIFYTSGENQGLPEPFPAPTHIGRKERSSVNRGTLYPPGTNSHHHAQRRYNDECRFLQNRPSEGISAQFREGQGGSVDALGGMRQRGGGRSLNRVSGHRGAR